ncbi:MAG: hypothetical protein RML36_07910 [Anaerolineae bacterium]|nr:hypothetical protein [Anaerolineae bacterium]MDW8099388.1 hypothetical protein [Anaerolineae bacterium]
MTFTWPQIMGVLGAGFLWGIAGLMALAGAQAERSGDREGAYFGKGMAFLAAGAGLAVLILALQ